MKTCIHHFQKSEKISVEETDDEILKRFGMKPCHVDLDRLCRIKMSCSVKSPDGDALKCILKQDRKNINSFTLHVKRTDEINTFSITTKEKENAKEKGKTEKKAKKRALVPLGKKPKQCGKLEIGDVILCKIRGYAEWPCFVTGLNGNSVDVKFFGDNTTFKTTIKNCFSFEESFDTIIFNLRNLKRNLYEKAVKEAEMVLGISPQNSILKQV